MNQDNQPVNGQEHSDNVTSFQSPMSEESLRRARIRKMLQVAQEIQDALIPVMTNYRQDTETLHNAFALTMVRMIQMTVWPRHWKEMGKQFMLAFADGIENNLMSKKALDELFKEEREYFKSIGEEQPEDETNVTTQAEESQASEEGSQEGSQEKDEHSEAICERGVDAGEVLPVCEDSPKTGQQPLEAEVPSPQ